MADFKEWAENQDITYTVTVYINDEPLVQSKSYDLDTAYAGANHFEELVGRKLQEEYESLYEGESDED